MPIYRNNDAAQGRYCMSPDGRIVFHEASQKTKTHDKQGNPTGWRECEESDLAAFPEHLLVHAGLKEAPPPVAPAPAGQPGMAVKIQATGTVTD